LRDVLIIAEMLNPKNITIILVGKVTFRPHRMMVLGRVWPKAGDKRATLAFQSEIFCIYLWCLFRETIVAFLQDCICILWLSLSSVPIFSVHLVCLWWVTFR
jgi:hypothetical protein